MRSSLRSGGGAIELGDRSMGLSSSSSSALTPGALAFGINSNHNHSTTWLPRKVAWDRSDELDIGYTKTPAEAVAKVEASLALGLKPLLIINTPDAEVLGKIVAATYAANALAIMEAINVAVPGKVKQVQIINEPYFKGSIPHGTKVGSNGSVYAQIVKLTYEKFKTAGLLGTFTLLIEALGEYNSYATLEKEEKQEQSGVFKKWVPDICFAMKDPAGMAIGDSGTGYAIADSTTVGREEAYQFTASKTVNIKELRFRTNGTANPGVTSLVLGVMAENAGKPGAVMGQGTFVGTEGAEKVVPTNSWVAVTGLNIALVAGTKYWLTLLPLGVAAKKLNYNAAVAAGGTGNQESTASFGAITETAEWAVFNQGPVGFQGGNELGAAALKTEINGWSNHPYGSLGAANGEGNFNWGSTEGFRTQVLAEGAGGNNNWWLTEWGWNTEGEQVERMKGFLEKSIVAHNEGWLQGIIYYHDGGDGYNIFGKPAQGLLTSFAETYG